MSGTESTRGVNPLARGAGWLATEERLPTSVRAVLGYYADTGVFDYRSLKLKSYVDDEIGRIVDDAYATIERELAAKFDAEAVDFAYDTKLTLPAELTLGYLYRRVLNEAPAGFNPITRSAEPGPLGYVRAVLGSNRRRRRDERPDEANAALVDRVERIEAVTALIVEALIDGDMRDALNDEEYDDFVVDVGAGSAADRRRVAEIAQGTLQRSIESRFDAFPSAVREAYRTAVDISERHQERDERFRELSDREDAEDAVRTQYKYATFDDPPALFDQGILDLPYFKTQYDRVGVIYDGMIDMYRGAGFEINDDFKRSIVLAIIGAQIWLDDVSDYRDDRAEGQLTPVTAEYLLADRDAPAYANVVDIAETYLDYAKRYATRSATPLTGIAIEYIYRAGQPSELPQG